MPSFALPARPMPPFRSALPLLACALLLTACGEPADTHPDKPVTQRRAAFNAILKQFEPMGIMLREKRYDADAFLQLAEKLEGAKDGPWRHFTPDSNYPPTKATDQVWRDPARFEAERQGFFQAQSRLLEAARSKDGEKVGPAYAALHDTCRSCHKTFKK